MRVRKSPIVLAAVAVCLATAHAQERPNLVGRAAPTFDLPVAAYGAMKERPRTLALKAVPDRPTVVLFIATECPVSNAYNARMAQLAKEYKDKGVDFVGINPNRSEDAAAVARHAEEHKLPFPVLKDPNNKVADLYDAQVTPEAYVVDTKGVIRYHGRIDNSRNTANVKTHDLRAAIDDVLAGRDVGAARNQAFGCAIKRVD